MNSSLLNRLLLVVIIGCVSVSCKKESDGDQNQNILDDIVSFTPNELMEIDHTEDIYFAHLGYESKVLDNGNIVFADRNIPNITMINNEGALKKVIRAGRGPGEVLDAYQFTKDSKGHIYTFDQDNDKLIIYDENLDLIQEVIPPNYEATSLLKAYPMGSQNNFLFELTSFTFLQDETKDNENILVQYDLESEFYGEEFILKAQPYARLMVDGRSAGATLVPYSYGNITAYNSENQTLFIFDTATDIIAEIDASFDTLRTIPVNIPSEKISVSERDSMKAAYNELRWDALKEVLPEVKAPVNKMLFENGEFWMESNIEGDSEMWFVLNMEGVIIKVVHLPKESILMHVSDKHLGVRLDDVTFALYENPKPEALN